MKTCFVSMPLGKKIDPYTGVIIDFDRIYRELIEPAISATQYMSYRIADFNDFSNVQKSIIELVINSDIMIVDLTMNNPDIMYELGIRHMAKRGLTIMICSAGTQIPADLSIFRVISYELNSDGSVRDKSLLSFHKLLRYSIESELEQIVTDSPVYQFFPEINVLLPEELTNSESRNRVLNKKYKRKTNIITNLLSKAETIENLNEIRSIALNDPDDVDPIEFVNLLKKYRDRSAWKDLVYLAEKIPDNLKKNPEVHRLYALALNRMGEQELAITIIRNLISQTGGDVESYGILGQIYKELFEKKQLNQPELATVYLDKAIENYKQGLEIQPDDTYTGFNVSFLLALRNDDASNKDLMKILPNIRDSLKNKMAEKVSDYWDYGLAIELSCIARDWNEAERLLTLAVGSNPHYTWMMKVTLHNLGKLAPVLNDYDKGRLNEITSLLQKYKDELEEGLRNA